MNLKLTSLLIATSLVSTMVLAQEEQPKKENSNEQASADEARLVRQFVNGLKKADPAEYERLEKLRKENPEEFKVQIAVKLEAWKKMRASEEKSADERRAEFQARKEKFRAEMKEMQNLAKAAKAGDTEAREKMITKMIDQAEQRSKEMSERFANDPKHQAMMEDNPEMKKRIEEMQAKMTDREHVGKFVDRLIENNGEMPRPNRRGPRDQEPQE